MASESATLRQQREVDQALGQHAARGVVHGLVLRAGLRRLDAGELSAQHDLVDRALRRAEAPVHRERARDVGGHVAVLAAGVDQQEVPVLHAPRVLDVVEDAGVGSRGHDRRIGVARGAVDAEDVLEHRLHLVLVHARPRRAHRLGVGVAADRTRAAQPRQLRLALAQSQIMQQRSRVLDPHR